MGTKTKKVASAAAATVLSSLLLLGGTLALQSINQQALNEAASEVNPGGRLHDDFNGTDKRTYVENFADEPIYARIRLLEYLERGDAAGKELQSTARYDDSGNVLIQSADGTASITAQVITVTAKADDNSTWPVHRFESTIHNLTDPYFEWAVGGSTVYLPTFNMNKDSLHPDVNGTLQGGNGLYPWEESTDNSDMPYSDHVEYSVSTPIRGYEIRDADSNTADELFDGGVDVYQYVTGDPSVPLAKYIQDKNIRISGPADHTPRSTAHSELISMSSWLKKITADGGYKEELHGSYWVYDEDGWCYYSQPIAPGTATGLLLSGITVKNTQENYYYAIHVDSQFITADDMGSEAEADAPLPENSSGGRKTMTLSGEGVIEFGTIYYHSAGIYKYTIYEQQDSAEGWMYDNSRYLMTVTVTEEADGLKAATVLQKHGHSVKEAVFTNLYNKAGWDERVVIEGVKYWDHGSNPKLMRPTSIRVFLYGNGQYVAEKYVTEADGWEYMFVVPKFTANGTPITYVIDELEIEHYSKHVDGYDLLNTYVGEDTPSGPRPKPTKKPASFSPDTGDTTNIPLWIGIFAACLTGMCILLAAIMSDKRKASRKKHR